MPTAIFHVFVSFALSFVASLAFNGDGETSKAVFVILGVVLFCYFRIRDTLYTICRNQQLIFKSFSDISRK